ncbi:MAG: ribonuclease III [Porticoccaceae bacterium]|nr:ribonuclease III [Porticoccaceae bacterium]
MSTNVAQLQERLDYHFADDRLLVLALSHRSFSTANNERLEFLGDSILGAVVTDYLYQHFPNVREGDLSRMRSAIVCGKSLAVVAKKFDIGQQLLLGPGEMKSGGHRRDSILGDTIEALIGAVYLDKDFLAAKKCILFWFQDLLVTTLSVTPAKDPKTALQEWLQRRGKSLPVYTLIHTGGEAHQRLFTVGCSINSIPQVFSATASSRRQAEQLAAQQLLEQLEQKS